MSDRNRVIAIFAGVAVVLGGGAFYYTKIYAPGQARDQAREEYEEWDKGWQALRTCLLGSERSSKVSESLAIHEMTEPSWSAKSCTPLVGKLARGPGESSGITAIEEAWVNVDRSGSKLADAFAHHVATGSSWKEDALPGAMTTLETARQRLRSALDLPEDRQIKLGVLPQADIEILDSGLGQLRTDPYRATANGVIYFGKRVGKEVQVVLRANRRAAISIVDRTTRAVPDPTWGASIEDGKLLIGPVLDNGTIAAPTATLDLPKLKADEQGYAIAGVAGTPAAGLVLLGNESKLVVARSTSTGFALDAPIPLTRATAEVDLDGRVAAIWSDAKRTPHARLWEPGKPDQDLQIKTDPEAFSALCLTRDRVWLTAPGVIYGLSAQAPISVATDGELVGCSADAAILAAGSGAYQVCAAECRQAMIADTAHLVAITDVGGKLVGVTSHAGVIGVWHEGNKEPTLYGLREPLEIAMGRERPPMALTDGTVIDALATAEKGYVTIRVPAK